MTEHQRAYIDAVVSTCNQLVADVTNLINSLDPPAAPAPVRTPQPPAPPPAPPRPALDEQLAALVQSGAITDDEAAVLSAKRRAAAFIARSGERPDPDDPNAEIILPPEEEYHGDPNQQRLIEAQRLAAAKNGAIKISGDGHAERSGSAVSFGQPVSYARVTRRP